MPAVLVTILTSLVTKLMTEKFLMRIAILGLETVAKRTENDVDDQLVEAVREAYYGPVVK